MNVKRESRLNNKTGQKGVERKFTEYAEIRKHGEKTKSLQMIENIDNRRRRGASYRPGRNGRKDAKWVKDGQTHKQ